MPSCPLFLFHSFVRFSFPCYDPHCLYLVLTASPKTPAGIVMYSACNQLTTVEDIHPINQANNQKLSSFVQSLSCARSFVPVLPFPPSPCLYHHCSRDLCARMGIPSSSAALASRARIASSRIRCSGSSGNWSRREEICVTTCGNLLLSN